MPRHPAPFLTPSPPLRPGGWTRTAHGPYVKRSLRIWRPAAGWALLILVVTTVPLPEQAVETGLPLDKAVHFGLYAGLGWSLGRAAGEAAGTVAAFLLAWVGGGAFAAADELHQRWIPARDPSLADWGADVLGLAAGLAVAAVLVRRAGGPVGADDEPATEGTGASGQRRGPRPAQDPGPGEVGERESQ